MHQITIGWAEKTFDLPRAVSLVGQFAERISEYIEKPLTVTALAVDSDIDQMVLCSVDLVTASVALVDNVRDKIKNKVYGLDPMKVVINAIHTHTGPGYTGRDANRTIAGTVDGFRTLLESCLPPGKRYVERTDVSANKEIMSEDELLDEISSKIAAAIVDAWEKRERGAFSNAFGRAVVGLCRRACYSDGSAQMWGDTNTAVFEALEGGNDSGIELLYFFDKNKELTGIVANLACPAQSVQHRLFVSPDFWGEVKMRLREHFGKDLFLLPQCSMAGDQCPVDLVRWVEPESDVNDPNLKRNNPPVRKADPSMFDLAGMRKVGKRIANEIIEVYREGLDEAKSAVPFEHRVLMLQLPLRRATLAEEILARREIREYLMNKPGDVDFNDVANLQVHLGVLLRMELQNSMEIVDSEIHVIRLGNVAIATNPYEPFLDFGNQIKARSLSYQTFLVQLANGAEGYIPTEKAERGGHYSAFISSGSVGHLGGEQLVRETLKNINQMFSE